MITRIVKVKVKPEMVDEFKAYILNFIKEAKAFKNNHHADCFADLEEQYHFHIFTIWNTEGALAKFRKSDINIEFKNNLKNWCEVPFSAWTIQNVN